MANRLRRKQTPDPSLLETVSISVVLTRLHVVFYQGDHILKVPKDKIRTYIRQGTMLIQMHPTNHTWTLSAPRIIFMRILPKSLWGLVR